MGSPVDMPAGDGDSQDSKQVSLLLDVAKAQVDEAFRVAELLETKARSLLQASTIFFGASQAAVGIQVAVRGGEATPTWVALTATVVGITGLLALAIAGFLTVSLQEPRDRLTVDVDTLSTRLMDFAERNDPRVSRFMLEEFATIVRDRRKKNGAKVDALRRVQIFAYIALGASAVQLLFGMVTSYILR